MVAKTADSAIKKAAMCVGARPTELNTPISLVRS